MKRKIPMAGYILIALVLGIIAGYMVFVSYPDKKSATQIAGYIAIISDVFLRLIKMLIGPLVFSTLVVGIAHMGDAKSVGRIFAKALGWFVIASIVSLLLGLLLANLLHPGLNLGLPLPDIGAATNLKTASFTLKEFVTHLVPRSFAEAMANNEILQIVVFSMFFGVALAALGDIGKPLTNVIDSLAHVMLKITGYVMLLAPVAVFAAIAATVATNGLEILLKFAVFMGDFYIGLIILWSLLVLAGFVFLGKRVFRLVVLIKEPFLLSFATASSEAAYPEDSRFARPLRRAAQDLELRAAHGLLVQPRRLDDVLHVRDHLHSAGLRHRFADLDAAHHDGDPDADLQRHGGRAARIAGGDRRHAQSVQHPRGRLAADPGRRHLPRHGALGDQRGGQLHRGLGRRQVGRRAAVREGG